MFTGRFLCKCQHYRCIQQRVLPSPIIQIQHCIANTNTNTNSVIEIPATVPLSHLLRLQFAQSPTLKKPFINSKSLPTRSLTAATLFQKAWLRQQAHTEPTNKTKRPVTAYRPLQTLLTRFIEPLQVLQEFPSHWLWTRLSIALLLWHFSLQQPIGLWFVQMQGLLC